MNLQGAIILGIVSTVMLLVYAVEHLRAYLRRGKKHLKIYVCSPFAGADEARNVEFAKKICRDLAVAGATVFCPHIFFTQFLNDAASSERDIGVASGQAIMADFDEVWFVLPWWRTLASPGMTWDLKTAQKLDKRLVFGLTVVNYELALVQLKADLRSGVRRAA